LEEDVFDRAPARVSGSPCETVVHKRNIMALWKRNFMILVPFQRLIFPRRSTRRVIGPFHQAIHYTYDQYACNMNLDKREAPVDKDEGSVMWSRKRIENQINPCGI
jgi:hypothetical protein